MTAPSDWDWIIQQRVDRGVAWFDERRPGWDHHIDLSTFSINDGCRCVFGQLAALTHPGVSFHQVFTDHHTTAFNQSDVKAVMALFGLEEEVPYQDAIDMGLTLASLSHPWGKLQREWERRIEARWAAPKAVAP